MNKKVTNATQQFYSSILILLYLGIGFIPNLTAVDQIAPQWLFLNGLNMLTLIYFLFHRDYFKTSVNSLINTKFFGLYIIFVIWSALSYLYAINSTEVLVNIARVGGVFIGFFNMFTLLKPMPNKFKSLSLLMSIYLMVEMYMILEPAFEMIRTNTFASRSRSLIGTTGNINIAALSMVMKLPFTLYLINTSAKQWLKWVLSILIGLVVLSLVFIASRASYVALTLMMLFYGIITFIRFKKEFKRTVLIALVSFYLPVVLGIGASQLLLSGQKKSIGFFERAGTIVNTTTDGSIAQRLRFYKVGLKHMASHPLITDIGLGNWKLASIAYDKEDIRGYVVPYHMHNDIIQIGAELGMIGFISYVGLFAFVLFFMVRIWKSDLAMDTKYFVAFLFLALMVYGIDANLNFPLARPIMQVMWILVIALSLKLYLDTKSSAVVVIKFPSRILVLLLLITTLPLSVVAYKTNLSLRGQQVLLGEYNSGELKYPLNQIEEVVPNIPNMSVTTLPIVAMKGRYYSKAGKSKEAIEHFQEGIKVNPYLGFSENLIAQEYKKMNQLDSALKYSRIAYNKLPIPPHFTNYLIQAIRVKDTIEINRMFMKDSADYNKDVWKNYLVAINSLNIFGREKYIDIAKRGMVLFPDQNDFRVLHKTLSYGKTRVDEALILSQKANALFSKGEFLEAAVIFDQASALDPLEFSYYENVGASYFSARAYDKALPYFKKVIEELNPKSGKSEYLMAISLINLNRKEEACSYLDQSKAFDYKDAANAKKNFCK